MTRNDNLDRLERADDFMTAVCCVTYEFTQRVGVHAWNYHPAVAQRRERTARILHRLSDKREAVLDNLARDGMSRTRARHHLEARRQVRGLPGVPARTRS
jgi:hypothetical protein